MASRTDASREPLSRERVLHAAMALADAGGIGSVTMRRVARELGVEAMSLYHHVANKNEILNSIVDMVESEIELPSPGVDWKTAIRKTAISYHHVLERHPWAANLTLSATGARPARWRYMNAILGSLREAGFAADMTDHAYHVLDSHITGFTLWASQLDVEPEQLPNLAATFLQEIPPGELPYLVEHVHQHMKERDPEDEGSFAFGLDLILDGLEKYLHAG